MAEAVTSETVEQPTLVAPKTLDGQDFPVESFKAAARELRRPFTENAVKFKLQSTWSDGGLVVTYIDARLVVERLNLVVPHLWHDEYETAGGDLLLCRLTIDGITREDVGAGYGRILKGRYSDALKRAAVKFGIGVSLYAIPAGKIEGKYLEEQSAKKTVVISPNGITHLRGRYTSWLEARGKEAFGDPLDHGDVEDAAGDIEVEAEQPAMPNETPAEPAPLDSPAAKALIEKAHALRKDIPAKDLPKAQFDRQLAAAATDMDALEKFVGRLEGLRP